jgi:hypothetical protein
MEKTLTTAHGATEPVYVVCDKCGKPTGSNLPIDPMAIAYMRNYFGNNKTWCSHCGHVILWSKAELWPLSVASKMFPDMFRV